MRFCHSNTHLSKTTYIFDLSIVIFIALLENVIEVLHEKRILSLYNVYNAWNKWVPNAQEIRRAIVLEQVFDPQILFAGRAFEG